MNNKTHLDEARERLNEAWARYHASRPSIELVIRAWQQAIHESQLADLDKAIAELHGEEQS